MNKFIQRQVCKHDMTRQSLTRQNVSHSALMLSSSFMRRSPSSARSVKWIAFTEHLSLLELSTVCQVGLQFATKLIPFQQSRLISRPVNVNHSAVNQIYKSAENCLFTFREIEPSSERGLDVIQGYHHFSLHHSQFSLPLAVSPTLYWINTTRFFREILSK